MKGHAANVVHQNIAVQGDVVANLEVITDAELHAREGFEVFANAFEDVLCQNAPKPHAKLDALGGRGEVKVVPEPQKRFDTCKFLEVNHRVIFRLERDVAGVEVERGNRGFHQHVTVTRGVQKLRQQFSAEFVAVGLGVLEFAIQVFKKACESVLRVVGDCSSLEPHGF